MEKKKAEETINEENNWIEFPDESLKAEYEGLVEAGTYKVTVKINLLDENNNIVGHSESCKNIEVSEIGPFTVKPDVDEKITNQETVVVTHTNKDISKIKYKINDGEEIFDYHEEGIDLLYSHAKENDEVKLTLFGYDKVGNLLTTDTKTYKVDESKITAEYKKEGEEALPLPGIFYTNEKVDLLVAFQNLNNQVVNINGTEYKDEVVDNQFTTVLDEADKIYHVEISGEKNKDEAKDENDKITSTHTIITDRTVPITSVNFYDDAGYKIEGIEQQYFNQNVTAVVTVEEKNFNKALANEAIKITRKDVNGDEMDKQIAINENDWSYDGEVYKLEIEFKDDGNYTLSVEPFEDLAQNKSEMVEEVSFTVDKTAPENLTISYEENLLTKMLNGITFGFFKDFVTVTVTAEDSVSGLESIALVDEKGVRLQSKKLTEFLDSDEANPYRKTATFKIDAQYKGNVSFTACNKSGLTSYLKDEQITVVDNISPKLSVSYTGTSTNIENVSYYNDSIEVGLTLTEENFIQGKEMNQISIVSKRIDSDGKEHEVVYLTKEALQYQNVNGFESYELIEWTNQGDDVYTTNFVCKKDGDYTFYVKYKDNSENLLVQSNGDEITALLDGCYEKGNMTLDTTAPKIQIAYHDVPAEGTENIFSQPRTAQITIQESNFDSTAAINGIKITDFEQGAVSSEQVIFSDWQHNGNEHTIYITYYEGKYLFDMEYKDLAGNINANLIYQEDEESSTKFIVDQSAPTDIQVQFKTPVIERMIEAITFGFYKPSYEISISASDDISGVNKIQYKFGENANWETADLSEVDTITKQAKITFTEDWNDLFIARVYNTAGQYDEYNDGKIYVFDSISPKVKIAYSSTGNQNTVDGVDYYSGLLQAKIVVNEENFFEGKQTGNSLYANDFNFVAEYVNNYGELHTIKYVPYAVDKSKNTEQLEYRTIKWVSNGAEHTANINFYNDGDYTFYLRYEDNSTNIMETSEYGVERDESNLWDYSKSAITLDNIQPEMSVSFADNAPESQKYFSGRKATITVKEHNFNAIMATQAIKIEATDVNGNNSVVNLPVFTSEAWKKSSEDIYTLDIDFKEEGNYKFVVSGVRDNAKNESKEDYSSAFTLDVTPPKNLSVKYNKSVIDRVLEGITFGFYKGNVSVTLFAEEDISGLDYIQYEFTAERLDDKTISEKITDFDKNEYLNAVSFTIASQNRGKLSFTACDKAGNASRFVDNRVVVADSIAPGISVLYSEENTVFEGVHYYNTDKPLELKIKIDERNFFEGLEEKQINGSASNIVNDVFVEIARTDDYNQQHKMTYLPEKLVKTKNQKAIDWNKSGDVYCANISLLEEGDYTITINYTDSSGNAAEPYVRKNITVDCSSPEINISYDDNNAVNGKYFSIAKRTATVVVKEHNFNRHVAKNAIQIASNSKSKDKYQISDWDTQGNVHTLKITYYADADFTFDMGFTDKAGNENLPIVYASGSAAANQFCLDTTNPTANIKVGEWGGTVWDKLISTITFNLWSPNSQRVEITADDNLSGVKNISYYISDTPLDVNQLKTLNSKWIAGNSASKTTFTLGSNTVNIIYSRVMDYAGNTIYLSSNGIILDNHSPQIDGVQPEISLNMASSNPHKDKNGNDIYNGDVVVDVKVKDPAINGVCSGLTLSKLSYKVVCDGKITQSGILEADRLTKDNKTRMVTSISSTVTISSELNNSNNIEFIVEAYDNAGNKTQQSAKLMIDITNPLIHVEYDNNNQDQTFSGMFKQSRTATIYIKERNFNADKVNIKITNTDADIPRISGWEAIYNNGIVNGDGTIYKATVHFSADGDYTFDIAYTDEAANKASAADYGNAVYPKSFTIDQTAPKITVSYDNNSVKNGFYFSDKRKATITISEHNFDESRITIDGNFVAVDGKKKFPALSTWHQTGDKYTATLTFDADGVYRFALNFMDKAGNKATAYEEEKFCIDQTAPVVTVTGINYRSANKSDIIGFKLEAEDTNFLSMKPKLYSSVVDEKGELKLSEVAINVKDNQTVCLVDNLNADGVYLLECTVVDKAGNKTTKIKAKDSENKFVQEQTIQFSVNRKGSTFILGTLKDELSGTASYEKQLKNKAYVKEVENNIVITEINPDLIVQRDMQLQINSETSKKLQENKAFTVSKNEMTDDWKEYVYSVDKVLFADEAYYSLSLETKDNAKNSSFSANSNAKISFTVDKTPPQLREVKGIDSNKIYNTEKQDVTLRMDDKLSPLYSLQVFINDQLSYEYNAEELLKSDGQVSFSIPALDAQQSVKLVAVDFAGNSTEDKEETAVLYRNIVVSTNTITLLLNSSWFFVIIICMVLLLLIVVFIVVNRRRKKKMQ